jgi:hypothetical protein
MFVTKVILLVLCVALACCTRVSVMTFNLFYGGTSLNLTDGSWCYPKPHGCPSNLRVVADAIRYAGADIVGLEETEGNTQAIAELLGWHWSARAHVISRFPLAQPHDPAMRAVLVEVQPAQWMVRLLICSTSNVISLVRSLQWLMHLAIRTGRTGCETGVLWMMFCCLNKTFGLLLCLLIWSK